MIDLHELTVQQRIAWYAFQDRARQLRARARGATTKDELDAAMLALVEERRKLGDLPPATVDARSRAAGEREA